MARTRVIANSTSYFLLCAHCSGIKFTLHVLGTVATCTHEELPEHQERNIFEEVIGKRQTLTFHYYN